MKSIYILLTRSNTFVSNLVKIATADRYTHVSISFDQSLDPLYSFARHYTYLALPAGLRTEYLDRGFFKRYPRIPCALYELTVEDEAYEKAKKAVEDMMEESEKYKFNVLGLFLCRLSIPSRRKRHYFCSEFVSKVLVESGAMTLPKQPSLMRPIDYAKLPDLTFLFEGRVEDLVRFKQPIR